MHRSRLAGFIIDCKLGGARGDLPAAARFWSEALGLDLGREDGPYVHLDGSPRDLSVEVQQVEHDSRVHLDIESDDVPAEVARLEKLGARRIGEVKTWVVMEAPTGQRFCVIRAKADLASKPGARQHP